MHHDRSMIKALYGAGAAIIIAERAVLRAEIPVEGIQATSGNCLGDSQVTRESVDINAVEFRFGAVPKKFDLPFDALKEIEMKARKIISDHRDNPPKEEPLKDENDWQGAISYMEKVKKHEAETRMALEDLAKAYGLKKSRTIDGTSPEVFAEDLNSVTADWIDVSIYLDPLTKPKNSRDKVIHPTKIDDIHLNYNRQYPWITPSFVINSEEALTTIFVDLLKRGLTAKLTLGANPRRQEWEAGFYRIQNTVNRFGNTISIPQHLGSP